VPAPSRSSSAGRQWPNAYIEAGRRWPDGDIDQRKAEQAGVLAAVELLRSAALRVRAARGKRTQEAVAARAGVYPETVGRLERGTAWLDVVSLTRILDAVDLGLRITQVR
jgi:hypothetical protein